MTSWVAREVCERFERIVTCQINHKAVAIGQPNEGRLTGCSM